MKNFFYKYQYLIFQIIAHAVTIWAIFYYSPVAWLLAIPFYILITGVGLSITFHRYITHKAFNFPSWMSCIGLFFGTLSGQGPAVGWALKHALHHHLSDTINDPHSPQYISPWRLYWLNLIKNQEDLFNKSVKHSTFENVIQNRITWYFGEYYWSFHLIYIALMLILGPEWLVFGYFVPACLSWVAFGYGVVIAAHSNGYISYNNNDHSRNNSWVSYLVFGEGYQNNHHKFSGDGDYTKAPNEWDPLGKFFKRVFPPTSIQ